MLPISHLLSSIFISRMFTLVFPFLEFNFKLIILSMMFQMLPDLDIFWAKKLNSHHITYFHSPLLWIIIFLIGLFSNSLFNLFSNWILYLFIVQVISHLFFDFMTGRTAGIPIFYPFKKKEFSLFPLNKEQGNFRPFNPKEEMTFFKYYLKSKIQVIFEILMWILGIASMLI